MSAYLAIQERVAELEAAAPNPLRTAIADLLMNHPAVPPHDACSPATAKMTRYKLANGKSLGHQIETGPQHLWFAADASSGEWPGAVKVYPPRTAAADATPT